MAPLFKIERAATLAGDTAQQRLARRREHSQPRPYQYSRFCDLYAAWRSKLAITMRQVHRAGEKAFIDYSGKKPGS